MRPRFQLTAAQRLHSLCHPSWRFALLALTSILLAPAGIRAQQSPPIPHETIPVRTATIAGTVTDEAGTPLSGIDVIVAALQTDGQWDSANETRTVENGTYTVSIDAPGTFRVGFVDQQRATYALQYYNMQPDFARADDLSIVAGETRTGIDAQLAALGSIGGTVTEADGTPIQGIVVRAYRSFDNQWMQAASATTGQTGDFTVDGLAPGTYRIEFVGNDGFYGEFYDGASNIEDAQNIVLASGENRTGINAQLSSGAHLRGVVTDEGGKPADSVTVAAYRLGAGDDGSEWGWVKGTDTNAAGEYDIRLLDPGTYRVQFEDQDSRPRYRTEYFDDKTAFEQANDITLAQAEVRSGIDASLVTLSHLSGRVVDQQSSPLSGITVRAYRAIDGGDQWDDYAAQITDQAGEYEFVSILPGTYRIKFDGSGGPRRYETEYYDNQFGFELASDIPLAPGESRTGIDAQLLAGATISGLVRDSTGNPLAGIRVTAYKFFENDQGGWWDTVGYTETETGADGRYGLDVAPGTYRIGFADRRTENHLAEYYTNTANFDDAQDITLSAGEERQNIDAQLVEAAHIRGTVTDEEGTALEGIRVIAYHLRDDVWQEGNRALSDSNGRYDVPGLRAGTYRVEFFDRSGGHFYFTKYYADRPSLIDATDLTLAQGEIRSGINAQLKRAAHITGTVRDEAGEPLANIEVTAYPFIEGDANDETDVDRWDLTGAGNALTDASGRYDIGALEGGLYRVSFYHEDRLQPPYAFEFYDDRPDILNATDLTLESGQTLANVDAVLVAPGGVAGRVTDEQGALLSGFRVAFYRDLSAYDNSYWAEVEDTMTDGAGRFKYAYLPPGPYRVKFFDPYESIEQDQRYLPEIYDNVGDFQDGTSITVRSSQLTTGIDAQLEKISTISGTVKDTQGAPVEDAEVRLYLADSDGAWRWVHSTRTDAFGDYSIRVVAPNRYRVGFFGGEQFAPTFFDRADAVESATDISITNGEDATAVGAVLAPGGHLSGRVTSIDGQPLSGIEVTVFRYANRAPEWIGQVTTDATGAYGFGGLGTDQYRIYFNDPDGRYAYEYYGEAETLDGATDVQVYAGSTTGTIDAVLSVPVPAAVDVLAPGTGVTTDPRTGMVSISMTEQQRQDVTIVRTVSCAGDVLPSEVVLVVEQGGSTQSYGMTKIIETASDYRATIPAGNVTEDALISVRRRCGSSSVTQQVARIQFFDPSGIVTDAQTGAGIDGAQVLLYQAPGWRPRWKPTDVDFQTCQSNLSKNADTPWNQQAPTQIGILAEPTSGTIRPAINPMPTDADGHYGWDVTEGCWFVRVRARGYDDVWSPVVGVPPAVTDLHIQLRRNGEARNYYLPIVARE